LGPAVGIDGFLQQALHLLNIVRCQRLGLPEAAVAEL